MIVRVLALIRLLLLPVGEPRPARLRRESARVAIWSGVAMFALLTAGMAAAVDTVVLEWRDPEFAHRLADLRRWKVERPQRPLVVAFGSSRTQMGLAPAVMDFPDEPGSPVAYNCGYRGAHPLGVWLQFTRVLDSGVKPDAILIQLAAVELRVAGPAEGLLAAWAPRFSVGDGCRLAPFTADPTYWPRRWLSSHLCVWSTYRQAVLSDLVPEGQLPAERINYIWELMDRHGFMPYYLQVVPDMERRRSLRQTKGEQGDLLIAGTEPEPRVAQVFRDLVGRCRAEGIPVAFYWMPESPIYRRWCSPAFLAVSAEFGKRLKAELGVSVFAAPEHFEETDFADGYHLLRSGAEKYSRWLADTHLKPWLRSQGLLAK